MKNQTNNPGNEGTRLDDYFKKGLQDYRPDPPARIWSQISRKLLFREMVKFNFTNLPRLIPIGVMTGVTLTAAWMIYTSNPENISSPVQEKITISENNRPAAIVQPAAAPSSVAKPSTDKNAQTGTFIPPEKMHKMHKTPAGHITAAPEQSDSPTSKENGFKGYGSATASLTPVSDRENSMIFPLRPLGTSTGTANLYLPDFPSGGFTVPKASSPSFFSASFEISPELTHYESDIPNADEYTWWTKLGMTWHISRFTVSSGVAYGYSTTESSYRVNYRSNDSIGFFTSVISFYIDPLNPGEVIFNTKNTTVYDSIDHLRDDRARSRYSYLRIPLLLGIDLLQTRTLTLNFQAGPAFTFMIGEKEAAPFIDYPNSRIVRIDTKEPPRISTGLQIWTGLHIDYQITTRFSIYAEPTFKYFVKTEYENDELPDKQPWSAGLGVGIQYNFGKK